MNVDIRQIERNDPLYQQERALRNRILLRPVGVPDFGWEMHDKNALHFVAVINQHVIGCVVLAFLDASGERTQLMQMAVETEYQGKGIGKQLVSKLIETAKEKGIKTIEIHARGNVTSFYEQFGFTIFGEPFEEVGIVHRMMKKEL